MTSIDTGTQAGRARIADMIRWGPTIAGVVIAAAVFATLDALWLALASGSADNVWRDGLQWYIGFTAAGSLFLAGVLAGLFSGVRGIAAGLVNGATAWGLLFLLSIGAVIPSAFSLTGGAGGGGFALDRAGDAGTSLGLWTAFWSLLAGGVLALLGGAVGGAAHRTVWLPETQHRDGTAAPARRDGEWGRTNGPARSGAEPDGARRDADLAGHTASRRG